MPYLKFTSEEQRRKAEDIAWELAEGKETISGLIAGINDPRYGLINFYSKEPYLDLFEKEGLEYKIIASELISAPYAKFLREKYQKEEFSKEL